MDNKLLRDKTNIFEFIIVTCAMTAGLFLTNLSNINIWKYSLDGLLGYALLVALAGISSYRTAIPGLLVAIILGLLNGDGMHMAVNLMTVTIAMYAYNMFSHLRPKSPLNVYEGALAGSVFHAALTYSLGVHTCSNFFIFLLLELLIALGTFKAGVNMVRRLGFINHEDPVLVAKIEKDWLQEIYNKINKYFKTNFHRPVKPGEEK